MDILGKYTKSKNKSLLLKFLRGCLVYFMLGIFHSYFNIVLDLRLKSLNISGTQYKFHNEQI